MYKTQPYAAFSGVSSRKDFDLNQNMIAYIVYVIALVFTICPTFVTSIDTTSIPSKPTKPIRLSSGETYDFKGRVIDGSNIKSDGVFKCWNAKGVTLMNVVVTNNPRYAFLARNCDNATIKNFKMTNMLKSVGGIRFDQDGTANGLTLINISGSGIGGHGIKIWNANGFNIDQININDTPYGCALLMGRSKNGVVGTVTGTGNSLTKGYATFRLANDNGPNIRVKRVVSRNSGRGVFILTGSFGNTIDFVDIIGARADGIYINGGSNNKVLAGSSRGGVNCRIRGGTRNSIAANCGGKILS